MKLRKFSNAKIYRYEKGETHADQERGSGPFASSCKSVYKLKSALLSTLLSN